ncbi:hypothetical protein NDU88_004288 [Pleurodeles waltl]|uniref:Secreted protein n=1 Tax=Pleurodeles waltl TaxID=8319 RepID=A0AAV7PC27_PLEWA|nr:hypothetical protein NDU88_004288 [Pleurodeles waltl]
MPAVTLTLTAAGRILGLPPMLARAGGAHRWQASFQRDRYCCCRAALLRANRNRKGRTGRASRQSRSRPAARPVELKRL